MHVLIDSLGISIPSTLDCIKLRSNSEAMMSRTLGLQEFVIVSCLRRLRMMSPGCLLSGSKSQFEQ